MLPSSVEAQQKQSLVVAAMLHIKGYINNHWKKEAGMKRQMLILGTLIALCIGVPFLWAECPDDESLVVTISPSELSLYSTDEYIEAQIELPDGSETSFAELVDSLEERPLYIICVGGIEVDRIWMIESPAEIDIDEANEVVTVKFDQQELLDLIDPLWLGGEVAITLTQAGYTITSIPLDDAGVEIRGSAVDVFIGSIDLLNSIGITTMVGTVGGDVGLVEIFIVSEDTTTGITFLRKASVPEPFIVDLTGGHPSLYDYLVASNAGNTVEIAIQATGYSTGTVSFIDLELRGSGLYVPGLNGSDTITITTEEPEPAKHKHKHKHVPDEESGCCKGGVTELTLGYNGVSAATIEVEQKNGEMVFGPQTVQAGGMFSFIGTGDDGKLGTEIRIYMDGAEDVRIHTSCSQPIYPGMVIGDFEVIGGSSKYGGPLQ